jgi:iron complex outermembrane receptor protein
VSAVRRSEYTKHNYWYGWINEGLEDVWVSHREHSVTPRYTPSIKSTPTPWCMPAPRRAFAAAAPIACPPLRRGRRQFKSDSLWSYEVGTKDTLFDNRMNTRVAAYRIDWNNIQQSILLPCTYSVTENAGRRHQHGRGIRSRHRAAARAEHEFGPGYDNAKITSVPAGATGFVVGQALNGVPKVTASLLTDYSVPTSFGAAFVRPQYSFTGRSVSYSVIPVQDGGRVRASYSMVDLHVGGDPGPGKRPCSPRTCSTCVPTWATSNPKSSNCRSPTVRPRYLISQPRTIGIEVKYRFNQ